MARNTVLVVSCSLNPDSRSRRLAEAAVDSLERLGASVELIDLQEHDLPLCDGDASFDQPLVRRLREKIDSASAILLATPVYNYALNAAAKNLVELTGRAWEDKPVGLLSAAGGRSSYMSPIGLANSLMFDFRCWIIPRFVYATRHDFEGDDGMPAGIRDRVDRLAREAVDMARALAWVRDGAYRPGSGEAAVDPKPSTAGTRASRPPAEELR